MNTTAALILIAASTAATITGLGWIDRRHIRRRHAADPRNERWLCETLECDQHRQHRGSCNQNEASQLTPDPERCPTHGHMPVKYCWDCNTLGPSAGA